MNRIRKQIAEILLKTRFESGKTQEYIALELGVSRKTVYNWENGIVAPTLENILDWFNCCGANPVKYLWDIAFPSEFKISNKNCTDEEIEIAFNRMVENLSIEDKRALVYLNYGKHGSSPKAVLHLLLAHLHLPLRLRYNHAMSVISDFEIEKESGNLICSDNIMPDLEMLKNATNKGLVAAINKQYGYVNRAID